MDKNWTKCDITLDKMFKKIGQRVTKGIENSESGKRQPKNGQNMYKGGQKVDRRWTIYIKLPGG